MTRTTKERDFMDNHGISAEWLVNYIDSFRGEDGTLHPLLEVKRVHSMKVRDNCALIADGLGWTGFLRDLALTAAVLHDAGRFLQFADYGTFFDGASVDHGDLGRRVLEEAFPWERLEGEGVKATVLESVRLHNKKILPSDVPPDLLPIAEIVRDSDKIDVFRLVRRHVEENRVNDLLPRLDVGGGYSGELVRELEEEGQGSYRNVRSLADFLLVQLSWAFDLNFAPSFRILRGDGTFSWIAGRLPSHPTVDPFVDSVFRHVEAMA
ncbi:HD domain-containing protein [Aminivibrio sp.]|jgi:hypothetical protein|uniref:HD domain-containing protein n=1 Tax=Aminivibrio sp. TaxID=1872489 RepID=UPI001A46937C|nr:HD domain-containing protein [Aminivibrio sp.]MBL3540112.1 HD domain-containing protein [Aminivibrio sp.]MDK2959531.1 hypothetical protein [Synergistaceae bacterium]